MAKNKVNELPDEVVKKIVAVALEFGYGITFLELSWFSDVAQEEVYVQYGKKPKDE